jgi:hypothetical protein
METVMTENQDVESTEVIVEKQTNVATNILNSFKTNKKHLKRPVIFVTGFSDDSGSWWIGPKYGKPGISQWIDQIVDNPEEATFLTFEKESFLYKSFIDFGAYLRNQIPAVIGNEKQFDLVGYSMGGLDIRAALTQKDPLLGCQNCITADTPHQGDDLGGILKFVETYTPEIINFFDNMPNYLQQQAENMDPGSKTMQFINSLVNRQLFLQRVAKFYQFMGTRDNVVEKSCFMDLIGLDATHTQKVMPGISVLGCGHTGATGVTLDVRTMLAIVYMLLDIEIPVISQNHGDPSNGNFAPPDDSQIFIG